MSDGADIEAARLAWRRLQGNGRRAWADWVTISTALAEGRRQATAKAGCDRPFGKRYTACMATWLEEAQLESIPQQVRHRCVQIAERLPEIEQWRSGLEPGLADTYNHPDSVWAHFRRAQRAEPRPAPRFAEHKKQPPSGDLFTTILTAIEGAWRSGDQLVLARAVYLAVDQMIGPMRKAA